MSAGLVALAQAGVAVALSGLAFRAVTSRARAAVAAAPDAWSRFGLALLLASVAVPAIAAVVVRPSEAPLRVMTDGGAPTGAVSLALPASLGGEPRRLDLRPGTTRVLGAAAAAVVLARLAGLGTRLVRLRRACAALPVVHAAGNLRTCTGSPGRAPFSIHLGRAAFVVVPPRLLADPGRRALVLAHEGHHLRQGHGHVALLLQILACILTAPLLRAWRDALEEIHELAADARVMRRPGASAAEYGRCLVAAAGMTAPAPLAPALSMARPQAGALRRRLQVLFDRPRPSRAARTLAVLACAAATASASLAAASLAGRLDVDRARVEAAALATPPGGLRVPLDPAVLDALQRRLGSAEGREATRAALARMPDHAPLMGEILRSRGLPEELLAVVLVESGFRVGVRPPADPPGSGAAGPWQFIPSTARAYGLSVTDVQDERLEPRRSTEAAAALLADLHAALGDWPLALQAYNQGRVAVARAVAEGGTRDALELERRGLLAPYASRVLAAVLVLRDPSLAG